MFNDKSLVLVSPIRVFVSVTPVWCDSVHAIEVLQRTRDRVYEREHEHGLGGTRSEYARNACSCTTPESRYAHVYPTPQYRRTFFKDRSGLRVLESSDIHFPGVRNDSLWKIVSYAIQLETGATGLG